MGQSEADEAHPRKRPFAGLIALNLVAILVVAGLAGLGTWQIQRRAWKHELIAKVEARVHAAPVPAPPAGARVTAEADAYRHVRLTGTYLPERTTLVQAVTVLGGGFWVLTPLRSTEAGTVLVNRGFVPADRRDPSGWAPVAGETTVTGLLRISEPGGGFLRSNDPVGNRWYSRDVAAIAEARGLTDVAPYFIDADAGTRSLPVGGLTVVDFPDNHLVYAITWFVLAAMTLAAALFADLSFARRRAPERV